MESKPKSTLIGKMVRQATFNRTSMESKPAQSNAARIGSPLLIEPVWNRNSRRETFYPGTSDTFNRTSMESKLFIGYRKIVFGMAFNRTSMESKRVNLHLSSGTGLPLLIEPVWNRNATSKKRCPIASSLLLIEPVWNRNLRLRHL